MKFVFSCASLRCRGLSVPIFVVALLAAFAGLVSVEPATAAEKYAAIAVDAATGEVIYSRNPDDLRYPASITKVMTIYILFQELRAGRMTLKTPIVMTKHAASMSPSKLGIAPGRSITADEAIRVLVTKSANDVAVAVGETISGSETTFAIRMTNTARSLGMSRTTFKNASGLPNSAQMTTARDLATLGLRIQRDFPDYYKYFSISSATVAGKTFRSHNKLIGKYRGTNGIKTGFINASGFNLIASVKRDGKHLVGVVMGGSTGPARDKQMKAMLDSLFPKVAARRSYTIAAYAGAIPPAIKASIAAAPIIDSRDDERPVQVAATSTPAVTSDATAPLTIAALAESASASPTTTQSIAAPETQAPTRAADGSWHIQVGAFPSESSAEKQIDKVKATGVKAIAGKSGFTQASDGEKKVYRARFSGFSQESAKATCKALSRKSIDCLALSPQG
ncbi:D-alanyl-D-alanine carboxypeptidase [Rhodoligotrophos appendicifer]|uniref:SPOR domain-containing protein n=1 Tax=Rhodoligotrophos appendicifer TaxID=987056 RepID=UPI001184D62A|nr:SPOR domain-containing protein [Rhodoligotrophos appendicifer]